ncbi:MAG: acyl-CoA dehydrogenase family protein [Candidatus Syntropharchaeia archaeon]
MEFEYGKEEREFQEEVRNFFKEEKATEEMRKEIESGLGFGPATWEILQKMGKRGWLTPTWPRKYGGLELPDIYRYIVMEELDYWTGLRVLVGAGMAGPIILKYGSEEQKENYLPRIARGEIEFALGYTEPNAGSDLASLEIRAEDKGDYFLMNGQKMFNTACHYAQYHWLGARTEDTKPKHRGISLFIVDLKTPGISLDPIWTMSGMRTNMVYYDNVEVPKECLVGEKNRGFYYIMEALDYERIYTISGMKRLLDEIVDVAKELGKNKDPVVRRRLAELRTRLEVARLFALRIPWILDQGKTPNYEAAALKITYSELLQDIIAAGTQILGPYAQLKRGSKWAILDGKLEWWYREAPRDLLTRGTCEIMRNIIATRGLGLPRR